MAITGATPEQYEKFLQDGGTLTLIVDKTEVGKSGEFERYPDLKDNLDSGFELPPTSLIYEPKARFDLLTNGDQWTRTTTAVYTSGGRIIYRRLPNGRYEAQLSIPKR